MGDFPLPGDWKNAVGIRRSIDQRSPDSGSPTWPNMTQLAESEARKATNRCWSFGIIAQSKIAIAMEAHGPFSSMIYPFF